MQKPEDENDPSLFKSEKMTGLDYNKLNSEGETRLKYRSEHDKPTATTRTSEFDST